MTLNKLPSALYQQAVDTKHITDDPSQRTALPELDRIHAALVSAPEVNTGLFSFFKKREPKLIEGLYMYGGVGTGKTLLMDMLVTSLSEKIVFRTHFHRFMQSVHHEKNKVKDQQFPIKHAIDHLLSGYQLLCLDEFIVTDITDAMILSSILEQLVARHIVLVTTSNTAPENLYQDQLQRARFLPAIDLIKQQTRTLEIDRGHDYRIKHLIDNKIYYTPLGESAEQHMQQHFDAMRLPYHDDKFTVTLDGRQVNAKGVCADVIWFDFSEICETHRSRRDYIEIAQRFHTVLISDIPVLDHMRDDGARRLIELIDELYDRSVNLIITAEAPAESIYQGKRLAEPFKRTVSRLTEMSHPDYLAKGHTLISNP